MKRLRRHLTREEVNDEEGDMEMADSVADKHTDGNRNHDGSDLVYGVERESREHLTVVPASSGKKIVYNNNYFCMS